MSKDFEEAKNTAEGLQIRGDYIADANGRPLCFCSVEFTTVLSKKSDLPHHVVVIRLTNTEAWVNENAPVDKVFYEIVLPVSELSVRK